MSRQPTKSAFGWPLVFLLPVLLLTTVHCSSRERINPLDPLNPETGGRPAGFRAVAGSNSVSLSWFQLNVPGLLGYLLSRRAAHESNFTALTPSPLPPDELRYDDFTAVNDTLYFYRLTFVLADGSMGSSVDIEAEPGPGAIWVGDAGADAILRYSPDGRERVFGLPGLNNPVALGIEPVGDHVWGASAFEGFAAVWEENGTFLSVNNRVAAPSGLAPVPGQLLVWIADEQLGTLTLYDQFGDEQVSLAGLRRPTGVAYDPLRAQAWVTDRAGRRLVSMDDSGNLLVDVEVSGKPWKVAVNLMNGDVWVTYVEDNYFERRAQDGTLLQRWTGQHEPFGIAFDSNRQWAWVTMAAGNTVVGVNPQGTIQVRAEGIQHPRGVAVDERTGEVWITALGSRNDNGELLRLSPGGVILSRTTGFIRPFTVAVDSFVN